MKQHRLYDVSIIGCGPFACFTAYLLAKHGLSISLIHPEKIKPLSSFLSSLSVCWPTLNDPPTRACAAHGQEMSHYLNSFCLRGLQFFKQELGVGPWVTSKCFRIGIKDFEKEELVQARLLGFSLKETALSGVYLEGESAFLCASKEEFQSEFILMLKEQKITFISSAAISVKETLNHCTVELENKQQVQSELVVLGNALKIAQLLPRFENILVPMSDSLFEYEAHLSVHGKSFLKNLSSFSFRASNGHVCGTLFQAENIVYLKISGPRFLLPSAGAGIDLTRAGISHENYKNIEKFHREYIFNIIAQQLSFSSVREFLQEFPFKLKKQQILVDCYPCDELPLLGEFGKFGRILGNTGWLATGFSAGAFAAKIICDLVLNEKSSDLHPRLNPRRMFKSAIF